MAKKKSPGVDRLPVEVYQKCQGMIEGVAHVWQHAVINGHIPDTMALGKLSLIHKKGDKEDLKNYQPLTLMSTDYKIVAKTIANRVQAVIQEVVGRHQTGFITRRQIKHNVIETYLVTKCRDKNAKRAIVLLDFEKAYDRVNRAWMLKVMEKLGFGPEIRRMVEVLHENAQIVVNINQALSKPIRVDSEVRQGCPLAPLLFAINTEPIRATVINSNKTQGIDTMGINTKLKLYADNTTGYTRDEQDFHNLKKILHTYCDASGGHLNEDKSSVIFLGPSFDCVPLQPIPSKETDRFLGYMLSRDASNDQVTKNTVDKFVTKCAKWSASGLSLTGRSAAIKLFVTSTLEYIAAFHTYSAAQITQIKKTY